MKRGVNGPEYKACQLLLTTSPSVVVLNCCPLEELCAPVYGSTQMCHMLRIWKSGRPDPVLEDCVLVKM